MSRELPLMKLEQNLLFLQIQIRILHMKMFVVLLFLLRHLQPSPFIQQIMHLRDNLRYQSQILQRLFPNHQNPQLNQRLHLLHQNHHQNHLRVRLVVSYNDLKEIFKALLQRLLSRNRRLQRSLKRSL